MPESPLSVMQNSFVGGEVAPSLYKRTKLDKYYSALRTMRNFIIDPHGPASNRPGTGYLNYTKINGATRLIPFTFSTVQAYALEFSHETMRVFKDGAPVVDLATNVSAATNASPVVVTTVVPHSFSNDDNVIISGVLGMLELNGSWKVANVAASTFELVAPQGGANPDGTNWGVYTSGGRIERVFEISTPYQGVHLAALKYEQSGDVIFLNHPSYAERELTRTGHTSWQLTSTVFGAGLAAPTVFAKSGGGGSGSIYAVTAVSFTGVESLISNSDAGGPGDTFTWNAAAGASYYNFYEEVNGVYGWLGYAGSTTFVVPLLLTPDMSVAPPEFGNYYGSVNNYPGVSAFYEQRLVRARTNNAPQELRGSVTGDFDNINASALIKDDDAYAFTINSEQVNEIKWIVPLRTLLIGTSHSIWEMSAGSGIAITPTNINIERQSVIGSSDLFPIVVGNSILFAEFGGAKIFDFSYTFEADGYRGNELTVLAPHLFKNYALTDWCYQRNPNSIVWGVRSDGALIGLTYYKEHNIWGWHRHDTDGEFKNITCISTASGVDDVYVTVRRVINGEAHRFVEKLAVRLPNEDVKNAFFVDSGLSLDAPISATGISNADPALVSSSGHGFSNGDLIDIDDAEGMTEVNGRRFVVANATGGTFTLKDQEGVDIDSTAYGVYVSATASIRKAVTVISGLQHLAGESVAVLADGNVVSNITVSTGGIVTLPAPASRVHIGLGYTCDLENLDFEFPTETGNTVQDKRRDIKTVLLGLENSRSVFVGPTEDRLVEVPFRDLENYDDPIDLYTGDVETFVEVGPAREDRVFIRVTDPLPITVTKIVGRVVYGES